VSVYNFLVTTFNHFIALFPASIQWLVTVLVLIGLVGALISLVKQHLIFIILAIILLPFIVPVLGKLIGEIIAFFVYLAGVLHLTSPTSST
jgi:hypothetical protein